MAMHDGLTGLPNRHLLEEQVDDHFARLVSGQKFAILSLDLDHFKDVNDTSDIRSATNFCSKSQRACVGAFGIRYRGAARWR